MMLDAPWLVGIAGAITWFAYFEFMAFKHPEKYNTLSRFIYTIGSKFPLSIWFMGVFAGGLAVHFFWHWDPTCLSSASGG